MSNRFRCDNSVQISKFGLVHIFMLGREPGLSKNQMAQIFTTIITSECSTIFFLQKNALENIELSIQKSPLKINRLVNKKFDC